MDSIIENFFIDAFHLSDPQVVEQIKNAIASHSNILMPKLGNFKGHLCEAIHFDKLKKISKINNVVKHPNGQKESPDLQFEHKEKIYWVEDINCSSRSYSSINEGCVSLRNYKHSYRNSGALGTEALYYEMPSHKDEIHILAVCLYPQTKKFEWRYSLFSSLPIHEKHENRLASNLKIPIEPSDSSIWFKNIEDLLSNTA